MVHGRTLSCVKLTIPRSVAVTVVAAGVVAGAVALEACNPCPPVEACYYDLQVGPDGGAPVGSYRRQLPDGAVTHTNEPCPPVPSGCPVA